MSITLNDLIKIASVSIGFSVAFIIVFMVLKAWEGKVKTDKRKCWTDIWADSLMVAGISAFRVSIVFMIISFLLYLGLAFGYFKFVESWFFKTNLLDIFHMKNTLIALVLAWIFKPLFVVLKLIIKNTNWWKAFKQKINNMIKNGTLITSVDELTDEIQKDLEKKDLEKKDSL